MDTRTMHELYELVDRYRGSAATHQLTQFEVNSLRQLADLLIYKPREAKSFDVFDMGLRISIHYMWVVREIVNQNIIERICTSSRTVQDYFNRNMRFVETGETNGKNVIWDGMIVAAIKNGLREPGANLVGNIGTTLLWDNRSPDPRAGISDKNTFRPLYTAPLCMSDAALALRWISRTSGFEEMMLFIARIAEIYFLVREKHD